MNYLKNNKKGQVVIIAIVVVVALIAGFLYFQSSNETNNSVSDSGSEEIIENEEEFGEETEVKNFVLTGENFKFIMDGKDNPDIIVQQGDIVRIEFISTLGTHDWRIDEFNAVTDIVREGKSTFVEFVADQSGTFEYYCGVGSHRTLGMKGSLIVE
jgi:plastocyanin